MTMWTKLGLLALAASFGFAACDTAKKRKDSSAEEEEEEDDDGKKKKKKKKKDKGGDEASAAPTATALPAPTSAAPTATTAPPPLATTEVPPISSDVTKPNIGTPEKPVTSPTQQTYAMTGIKTISDTCSNAHVILTQAPESVDGGVNYEWKYSRQAMLANQQYQVVSGTPTVQGQVSFQVHQADERMSKAYVLVANCADGVTCNHLAAMYKSIVKSSNPQAFCGDIPPHLGPIRKRVNLMAGGPLANLPASNDVISKCARLAACTVADRTDTTDDVGIACQKSPSSFKTDCASRYPCAEVLACAK